MLNTSFYLAPHLELLVLLLQFFPAKPSVQQCNKNSDQQNSNNQYHRIKLTDAYRISSFVPKPTQQKINNNGYRK